MAITTNACPGGWSHRIHQLLLCRGVRPHPYNECPWYDTKQSNCVVPVILELWGMLSTPSLPSLPGPLWPWVVAPDRVLSMGQIELNCVLMLNWIAWNRTVFCHWNCELMLHLSGWNRIVYMYKNGFDFDNLQWLMCYKTKPNQTKNALSPQHSTFGVL